MTFGGFVPPFLRDTVSTHIDRANGLPVPAFTKTAIWTIKKIQHFEVRVSYGGD